MNSQKIQTTKHNLKERIDLFNLTKNTNKQIRIRFDVIQKESLPYLSQNNRTHTNSFKGFQTFVKAKHSLKKSKQLSNSCLTRPDTHNN
jgi:hypothetical protein